MSKLTIGGCLILAAVSLCAQTGGEQPGAVRLEINGTVLEYGFTHAIPGAEITIHFGESEVGKVTTDDHGSFRFPLRELGEYFLYAKKDGYDVYAAKAQAGGSTFSGGPSVRGMPINEVRVILDAAHPRRDIRFSLGRTGEMLGRAINADSGEPLANFPMVLAEFFYRSGVPQIGGETKMVTDSEGRFRVTGISPGLYIVIIRPRNAGPAQFLKEFSEEETKALDQDYETSYWPGGGGLETAYGVSVPSGGFSDVGVVKVRKTPFYRVHVSVPASGCNSGDNVQVRISNMADIFSSSWTQKTACGSSFLVRNLQPGTYSFNLSLDNGILKDVLVVDVKNRNIDVTASLRRGVDVESQFIFADNSRPLPFENLQAWAWPLGSFPFMDEMHPAKPDAQGKFRFENLSPGRRRLDLTGVDSRYYVKEVRYNDVVISGSNFMVIGGGSLQIVLDDKPAVVSGLVLEGDYPASQPYIVLSKWPTSALPIPPKTETGGADGKFQLTGLAPGEYRIFAVSQTDRHTLDKPGVMDRLVAAAEKISLNPSGFQNLSLKLTDPAR